MISFSEEINWVDYRQARPVNSGYYFVLIDDNDEVVMDIIEYHDGFISKRKQCEIDYHCDMDISYWAKIEFNGVKKFGGLDLTYKPIQ